METIEIFKKETFQKGNQKYGLELGYNYHTLSKFWFVKYYKLIATEWGTYEKETIEIETTNCKNEAEDMFYKLKESYL